MLKKLMIATLTVGLAGCGVVPPQPANPQVVSAIVGACTADGVFKAVGGRLVLQALPYVGLADSILAVGVDRVCSDPERYATDASTALWVTRNLGTLLAQARARTRP